MWILNMKRAEVRIQPCFVHRRVHSGAPLHCQRPHPPTAGHSFQIQNEVDDAYSLEPGCTGAGAVGTVSPEPSWQQVCPERLALYKETGQGLAHATR